MAEQAPSTKSSTLSEGCAKIRNFECELNVFLFDLRVAYLEFAKYLATFECSGIAYSNFPDQTLKKKQKNYEHSDRASNIRVNKEYYM